MIAIVASTFPRFQGDTEPGFMLDFALEVAKFSSVEVYVPNHPAAARRLDDPTWPGIPVKRFRYFPLSSQEVLCGDGGIPAKLKSWKGKFLLPFLILAEVVLFLRILRDSRIKTIHVHWVLPQGFAFAVASTLTPNWLYRRRPQSVLSFHSGRAEGVSGAYEKVEKWILKHFDRITVNNSDTCELLNRVHNRKIKYLSMGLPKDVESWSLVEKKNYRKIATVGRFVPVKGYLELLDAWAMNKDSLLSYHLTILGKGSLAAEIRAKISDLKLMDNVELRENPSREVIRQVLSETGYYIQPSLVLPSGQTEGFGLSVLEAMHLGCTPLVNRCGGLPEVAGSTGFIFEDAAQMLKALLRGSVHPKPPIQCREAAATFTWGRKNLKSLYES